MTEVEKRRIKLLHETRKNYSDKYAPPAIHPRYQSTYQSLYGIDNEESTEQKNTLLTRFLISVLILALFFVLDYKKSNFGIVDSQFIVSEIQKSFSQSFPTLIK